MKPVAKFNFAGTAVSLAAVKKLPKQPAADSKSPPVYTSLSAFM